MGDIAEHVKEGRATCQKRASGGTKSKQGNPRIRKGTQEHRKHAVARRISRSTQGHAEEARCHTQSTQGHSETHTRRGKQGQIKARRVETDTNGFVDR